ncbi:hypothetical protein DCC85_04405 [Paenibacillus sp. CAA11]|uniref:hypothetical protein n=1 Tax=Paenibacillus sp. CAA11 TaxID=1532905 RepID=UPI000D3A9868|nr:hypothetical protein [Paenibacillus sp. CAA11]AWB43539.1 hypothetical protein DCC85_04405 [Paenibacillus sp. CAA11]
MVWLPQFKTELRRHIPVVATLIVLSSCVSLYFAWNKNSDYAFTYLLINMVIGILIPVYIFVDYYQDFYIGKRSISHTLPLKTSSLFWIKSVVFLVGIMLVWASTLLELFLNPHGLYHVRMAGSSSPLLGVAYIILSKLAGAASGLAVMGLALAAAKLVRVRAASYLLMACIIVLIVAPQFLWITSEGYHFKMGTSDLDSFKQYAGMLSVSISYEPPFQDINETIRWASVWINAAVAVGAGSVLHILFNSSKYEVYGN